LIATTWPPHAESQNTTLSVANFCGVFGDM
jgi:hypothetical protein